MRFVLALTLIALVIAACMASENIEWAVELHPSANADEIAARHGFENTGKIGNLQNHYLFRLQPQHASSREVAEERGTRLASTEGVVWSEKQEVRQMVKKPNQGGRAGMLPGLH